MPWSMTNGGLLCLFRGRRGPKRRINQKMVSTVNLLLGGDLSDICFCRSMKLIPLFANSLLRLITESLLYFAIARSACTSSYLQVIKISIQLTSEKHGITGFKGHIHTLDEHQSVQLPSWYSCEQLWRLLGHPQTPHTLRVYDPTAEKKKAANIWPLYSQHIIQQVVVVEEKHAFIAADRNLFAIDSISSSSVTIACSQTTEMNPINIAKKHTF